jgi:hypothetical protein
LFDEELELEQLKQEYEQRNQEDKPRDITKEIEALQLEEAKNNAKPFKFYQRMLKKDRDAFMSASVQSTMDKDSQVLGEAFFD